MSAAAGMAPRAVAVVAGLDERQLQAAFDLHAEQARERGFDFDGEAWALETRDRIMSGAWNVGVAWDGERPVGVTEMFVEYDAMLRRRIAWGQRAYVLPEYRQADVFTALFNFGVTASAWLGIPLQRAVAENDFYGQAMKRFYESQGFKVIGYVLQREAP